MGGEAEVDPGEDSTTAWTEGREPPPPRSRRRVPTRPPALVGLLVPLVLLLLMLLAVVLAPVPETVALAFRWLAEFESARHLEGVPDREAADGDLQDWRVDAAERRPSAEAPRPGLSVAKDGASEEVSLEGERWKEASALEAKSPAWSSRIGDIDRYEL